MKVRQKITLWIAGTALVAAVSFSAFVAIELLEQPYELIDDELHHMANALVERGRPQGSARPWGLQHAVLPYSPDAYWIRVTNDNATVLYESALTPYAEIPPSNGPATYTVEQTIPRELIRLDQDEEDGVAFRVLGIRANLEDGPVNLLIAKPIEDLEEEVDELLRELGVSLVTCTLLVLLASYFLAGRILRPLVTINRLAREISEKSLDRRIPLGANRDEIHALSVSLNRMFDRLRYSFQRQREYIGNASHELKSPLTLLMLTQEGILLRPDLDDSLRTECSRQLDTMRRMSRLVGTLLDLSRLEQQEITTNQALDLAALANTVLEEYAEMLAARGITVENRLAGALPVQGDLEQLRRLLINLIDNAIRYNLEEKGRIVIGGDQDEDWVQLQIANTGPAIPAAETEHVFEQFYRVEKSRSAGHGGTGLGLTISRKIVELHNGTITLSNEEGGWTRLTVTLPADLV